MTAEKGENRPIEFRSGFDIDGVSSINIHDLQVGHMEGGIIPEGFKALLSSPADQQGGNPVLPSGLS